MTERTGFIYLIRNTQNGNGYIGKTERTIAEQFAEHVKNVVSGSLCTLHAAMREDGSDNFTVSQLLSFENDYLHDLRKRFIAIYGTHREGYNVRIGKLEKVQSTSRELILGERVASLRREKGWSQSELTRAAGLTNGLVSRLEDGTANPQP